MGLLELCEKYYGTFNLYEVLQINEKATDKEVKKAYHKLSLKVHPDRVPEEEKLEATEKFKVLGSIHAILTDQNKRALYDETKTVDDDDYHVIVDRDWTIYWRLLFKKITDEDIRSYELTYTGSEEEKQDIKKAYLNHKGDMDGICDAVPFARSDQESRIRGIIDELIKTEEVPAYKLFTHESAKKRQKRFAKENKEAKEAEELKEQLGMGNAENSLEQLIKNKQQARAKQIDTFIDDLAAKYGGGNKTKGKKRKAPPKSESTSKTKRRK